MNGACQSQRIPHIVQISSDDSVFSSNTSSDTLLRQQRYVEIMRQIHKGAISSFLVVTQKRDLGIKLSKKLNLYPIEDRKFFAGLECIKTLRNINKRQPITLICTQDISVTAWWILVYSKLNKIPIIGQIHYDFYDAFAIADNFGNGIKGKIKYLITDKIKNYFNALRVVNTSTAAKLRENGMPKTIEVIPVPITMKVETHGGKPNANNFLILFVGRLVPAKNLHLWLEVARELINIEPRARFKIIGSGPLSEDLKKTAAELSLTQYVDISGPIEYRKLSKQYYDASIFLLTSHYEGFGRVLVEALMNQTPVVCTNIAGSRDIIVNNVNGILLECNTPIYIALKISELMKDNLKRLTMGHSGMLLAKERFDPDVLAERWVHFMMSYSKS